MPVSQNKICMCLMQVPLIRSIFYDTFFLTRFSMQGKQGRLTARQSWFSTGATFLNIQKNNAMNLAHVGCLGVISFCVRNMLHALNYVRKKVSSLDIYPEASLPDAVCF